MNISDQIKQLEQVGRQIKAEGFTYNPFVEACHLYWNLIIEDAIEFSPEHVKLVDAEELKRASERQIEGDFERMYGLLPKTIRKKLTIEEMIAEENSGLAGFMQAFQGQGVMLGVYNHNDDICYVLEPVPATEIWGGHPNAFHAVFAAHELGHRYVRIKRESLGMRGIGNAFREEKYCGFLEAGFNNYVFGNAGKETDTEGNIIWRRDMQKQLEASLFDPRADAIATEFFIAKYRNVVKTK